MLIAFHKPFGVLSQFTVDHPGQRTLAEFGLPTGVYPLGRLDADSEGLLLLSDEKGLNFRLLDPAAAHPRTYLAQVEGQPEVSALERLAGGGLAIRGHRTRSCKVRMPTTEPELPPRDPPIRVRKAIPTAWLELTLIEGKNRQVRRMTAAVGLPTLRLVRIAIGEFSLGGLEPGAWRKLDDAERAAVMADG